MSHRTHTRIAKETASRGASLISIAMRLIVTGIALCGMLAAASRVVQPKNNQAEFGQSNPEAYGVLGEPNDSIDVLFLGDSEAFCSFSPLQLWNQQGITSYVCGTSGQQLTRTSSLLAQALAKQQPRVVVLETNCLFRELRPIGILTSAAEGIFPAVEYHNRWKSLRAEDFTTAPRTTWTHEYKGFLIKTETVAADARGHMAPTDEVAAMPILNLLYAREIARTCQAANAELVLVSTPSTVNWNMARHNRVQQLADELGADYVDLNTDTRQVAIDWSTDTCDGGDHLNIHGAQKVTTKVGEMLRTAYRVPSHAGEQAYGSWDEAYARYAGKIGATQP